MGQSLDSHLIQCVCIYKELFNILKVDQTDLVFE